MSHRKVNFKLPETCTGCRTCEMVCSLYHEKNECNPEMSRIRIARFPDKGVIVPMICRFCEDAPCVKACPEGAIYQNAGSEVIRVNEDVCTGCGLCKESCEFGGITIHPIKKSAIVCDTCDGKILCVKYCVNRTLDFLKPELRWRERNGAQIDRRFCAT